MGSRICLFIDSENGIWVTGSGSKSRKLKFGMENTSAITKTGMPVAKNI